MFGLIFTFTQIAIMCDLLSELPIDAVQDVRMAVQRLHDRERYRSDIAEGFLRRGFPLRRILSKVVEQLLEALVGTAAIGFGVPAIGLRLPPIDGGSGIRLTAIVAHLSP
jgi:hypothetical protein